MLNCRIIQNHFSSSHFEVLFTTFTIEGNARNTDSQIPKVNRDDE